MTYVRLSFIIAAIGHLLCLGCDRLIALTKMGAFSFNAFENNERLSSIFENASPKHSIVSIHLIIPAMTMSFFGYAGFSDWIREYSSVCANIILITSVIAFFSGIVYHCICAAAEWMYISMDRTEQARLNVSVFFKNTAGVMMIYFAGLLINAITMAIAVITGNSPMPVWGCIFNMIPLFLILSPFRFISIGNIAGMIMFLGLALF